MPNQITPKLFTMPAMAMGITLGVYVLVVVIAAGIGFGLTGSLAEISRKSTWQCSDSEATVFDNNTCSGVDFAKYNTTVMVSSPSVTKLSKTLLISLVFERVGNWSTVLSTNIYVDVLITGMDGNEPKEVVVHDSNYSMHVYCPNASNWCNPSTLNHINILKSEKYDVKVSLVSHSAKNASEIRVPWMGDTVVLMQSAHVSYTYISMIWGGVMAAAMLALMIVFVLVCVRVHGLTLQFRWILLLLGTCVLYNRPLEVLSVYFPGGVFESFEQLCISTFVCLLCGFWLTLFRNTNNSKKMHRFFEGMTVKDKIIRILFYVVPIVFSSAILTWQRIHDRDQYDLLHMFGYEVLSAVLIVMMCFYTGITLYALFRVDGDYDPDFMTISNHKRRMVFFCLSFIVLFVTVMMFLIGMLVPSFLDHLGRDIFLSIVLNGYMVVLVILSWPTARRTHYKVSTKNNVISITEIDDDGTSSQSIDISGTPHSSFSLDFNFARADGTAPPMSPSGSVGRHMMLPSSDSNSSLQDTLPVPKESLSTSSISTMDSTQDPSATASDSESVSSEDEEPIIVDV